MNFLNKMERKFGRYALTNLSMYIVLTYAAGYLLYMVTPQVLNYMTLEPAMILRGQVWRIVSWLLIPPSTQNIFFTLTIIGAFILYFVLGGNVLFGGLFSTYYISMSIFLAYAATYPNNQVLFMMIIPLKIKWLGVAYALMILAEMIQSGWAVRVAIICSLMNFIIFFFMTRNMSRYNPKEIHRRKEFQRAVHRSQVNNNGITKHKCAICGRTEKDGEHLEFRFCSKCNGNYEYCQDHLFTHTHIR